jgi:hypothetical protein
MSPTAEMVTSFAAGFTADVPFGTERLVDRLTECTALVEVEAAEWWTVRTTA